MIYCELLMEKLSNNGHIASFLGLTTESDLIMRQNQKQNRITFIKSGATCQQRVPPNSGLFSQTRRCSLFSDRFHRT